MRNKLLCGFLAVVLCMAASNLLFTLFVPKIAWSRALSVALGSFVGLVLGAIISNYITKNITKLVEAAQKIGKGDLTQEITIQTKDEIGHLANAFRVMLSNLRDLVSHLENTSTSMLGSSGELVGLAGEVNVSSEEIAATMDHISRGAEKQSRLAEKGFNVIKDIVNSIENVTVKAKTTASSAIQAGSIAKTESKLMQEAMKNLGKIFSQIENSTQTVKDFGRKIKQVTKFLDMITSISQQTNTLSFNATIEATRAGEFGKGFSVVADEMRRLAERTKEFTIEVTDITEDIEKDRLSVLLSMENEAEKIEEGKGSIETTIKALGEMVKNITDITGDIQIISEITQKQKVDSEEIVQAMHEVAELAEENATATEEVAIATEELVGSMEKINSTAQHSSSTSHQLKEAITGFKLVDNAE